MAEKKSGEGTWRTHYTEKRAELFHRKVAVLCRFADVPKIPTEVLNVLERLPSFLVKLLQTIFHLVKYTFCGEEVLKEEKNRNV